MPGGWGPPGVTESEESPGAHGRGLGMRRTWDLGDVGTLRGRLGM